MTPPREPDRFDKQARELLDESDRDGRRYFFELLSVPKCAAIIAAALRASEAEALERAARKARDCCLEGDTALEVKQAIRALVSPAAAPAAETRKAICECGHDAEEHADYRGKCFNQAHGNAEQCDCTVFHAAPPSGPVASAPIRTVPMMPVDEAADARIEALRAAQPPETSRSIAPAPCTCHYEPAEFCRYHGPLLKAERASGESPAPSAAEKRIAELEEALRSIRSVSKRCDDRLHLQPKWVEKVINEVLKEEV